MLALILVLLSQDGSAFRVRDIGRAGHTRSASFSGSGAAVEAAGADAVGMPATCSCGPVYSTRRDPFVMTRASSAYCYKGVGFDSPANGDLVLCNANQPRTMPCDNSGIDGIFLETTATNTLKFSNAFGASPTWTVTPNVTVTNNTATAPNGLVEAERVQIGAVDAVTSTLLYQTSGCTDSVTNTLSVYVKGNGTSGTLDLSIFGVLGPQCADCTYNATTWTRCKVSGAVGTGNQASIGNDNGILDGCNRVPKPAHDILVWGGQCETGAIATSLIRTVNTVLTRLAEVSSTTPYFQMRTGFFPSNGYSLSSTVVPVNNVNTNGFMALSQDSNYRTEQYFNTATEMQCSYVENGSLSYARSDGGTLALGVASSSSCSYTGINGTRLLTANAAVPGTVDAGGTLPWGASRLYLGAKQESSGTQFVGCIKKICADSDPTRCTR